MVGLLIVTHANMAGELLRAAEMIIGPADQARAIAVSREDSVEKISQALSDACDDVARDGDGIIIMTDMFGGTPTNLSLALTERYESEIITGVNLPMVIKFFNSRHTAVKELAPALRSYAADKISVVSELLSDPSRGRR